MTDRRVLVVDDEIAITEGLMALFECEHLESAAASDRQSAEAILDGGFFPVVLADLCLHTEAEGLALIDHVLRRRIATADQLVRAARALLAAMITLLVSAGAIPLAQAAEGPGSQITVSAEPALAKLSSNRCIRVAVCRLPMAARIRPKLNANPCPVARTAVGKSSGK